METEEIEKPDYVKQQCQRSKKTWGGTRSLQTTTVSNNRKSARAWCAPPYDKTWSVWSQRAARSTTNRQRVGGECAQHIAPQVMAVGWEAELPESHCFPEKAQTFVSGPVLSEVDWKESRSRIICRAIVLPYTLLYHAGPRPLKFDCAACNDTWWPSPSQLLHPFTLNVKRLLRKERWGARSRREYASSQLSDTEWNLHLRPPSPYSPTPHF